MRRLLLITALLLAHGAPALRAGQDRPVQDSRPLQADGVVRLLPGLAVRLVSLRVAAIGRRPAFDFSVFAPDSSASLEKATAGSRQVWFDGGWRATSVWSRLALPAGAAIEGPAILEQPDATTVIEPGHVGRVDALGNVIVEPA